MTYQPIIPNPGSELNPENFVGRRDVTTRANEMFDARQRVIISDPRRMGKTFWMKTYAAEMEESDRYRVVFIDYQGVDSLDEFLTRTARELAGYRHLPERFAGRIRGWFDNVDLSVSKGPITLKKAIREANKTPLDLLEELLKQLDKDLSEDTDKPPLVIAMDEVADAVHEIAGSQSRGIDEAHNLLKRLRNLRNGTDRIRWIIAGSVGFHHVLAACGANEDVYSDLDNLRFGPLSDVDATELAKRLALGINRPIDDEAIKAAVEVTSAIPSLIQKIFYMMRIDKQVGTAEQSPITALEVQACLSAFIDDRDESRDVTQYVSRIESYYREDSALAHRILAWTAASPGWKSVAELENDLCGLAARDLDMDSFVRTLSNLIDDHYLEQRWKKTGYEVRWRYEVIRTIYRRRRFKE